VVVGLVVVATPGLGGHASTGRWRWFALPADIVHVAAMATWLGGLVLVLACVLPVSDPVLLRRVVPRFSRVAMWCIVAIVASGSFQAWRQVGSLHAFTSTDYGRLLLVKLAGVVVILAAAALSREVVKRRLRRPYEPDVVRAGVPVAVGVGGGGGGGSRAGHADDHDDEDDGDDHNHEDDADDDEWTEEDEERAEVHRLRLSVAAEVVVAVFVLAVTALLVNAPPAYTASNLPYFKTVEQSGRFYDIEVTPAKAGPNDLHLTAVTVNGGPADVIKYTATFSEPGKGIAPIAVPLLRLGPGHYASYAFRVPFPGTWQLSVSALISDTEESTFTLKVPIH
jgi:copper transport protein